jgi:hypothetical protein
VELLTRLQANDDGRTEALRALGGLLLGTGVLVLLMRRSSLDNPWGDLPRLVAWLVPAAVLYGGGVLCARAAGARAWHAVWVVFGLVFVYGTLIQFLALIEGDPDAPLNTAWTLGVVAAAGVAAAVIAKVRFGWLVAGLALAIAWLAVWDEVLADGVGADAGTFRGLCMLAALLLVAAGWFIERRGREGVESAELVTAAGVIFLLGAAFVSLSSVTGGLFAPTGVPTAAGVPAPAGGAEASLFWDVVLLGGSILSIAAGNLVASRGPVYVGAVGILAFVLIVGLDLDDETPAGKILGWPLVLLALAAAAVLASIVLARRPVGQRDQTS